MYVALAERLHLDWLREQVAALPRPPGGDSSRTGASPSDPGAAAHHPGETLARDALRKDFFAQHRALTAEVLRTTDPDAAANDRLGHGVERNEAQVRRCEQILGDRYDQLPRPRDALGRPARVAQPP